MNSKRVADAVKMALAGSQTLNDAKVIAEFPNSRQPLPLNSPILSVGVNGIKVENDEQRRLVEGQATGFVEVGVSVCVPKAETGEYAGNLLDRAINSLNSVINQYTVLKVTTGGWKYSSSLSALVCEIVITFACGNAY